MKVEKFCEFGVIKNFFNPLTPYGKDFKENLVPLTDKDKILRRLESIELILRFRKEKKSSYDKIRYHLKNIPYLSFKTPSDIADIFIIKKFINNYYQIYLTLNSFLRNFFGFNWELDRLLSKLNPDGFSDNFYISEKYDQRLTKLREELGTILSNITKIKEAFKKEVFEKFFINLEGDFVVYELNKLQKDIEDYFLVDFYDSKRVLLKPKYGSQYINLLKERENVISKIRTIENEIIADIINDVKKDIQIILSYIKPIIDIDVAIASAELAYIFNLKKPILNSSKITIKNGVFIPLKRILDEIKVPYTPLNFSFDKRINVIQGSNMGGKTVVLKTITLLQYMTQCGLYVAADEFKTIVFDKISIAISDEEIKGLSSFAYEIYSMSEEIKKIKDEKILIIADEFAKTTNFNEAVSLINAIIDYFSAKTNVYFFFSTHFSGIKGNNEVAFLRMKGFNREKYMKFSSAEKKDINEKIKFINKFMDYELIKIKDSNNLSFDAIEIARIIGINEDIYLTAKKYMEESYEEIKKTKTPRK